MSIDKKLDELRERWGTGEIRTNSSQRFIRIPQDEDDPRFPAEIINLDNVDFIQVLSEKEVALNFGNGRIETLTGDRADCFLKAVVPMIFKS